MKHKIYVRRDKPGLSIRQARHEIARAAVKTLEMQGITLPCGVSVLLTDGAGIRAVNAEQRGIDRETDVLSFPQYTLEPGKFSADMVQKELDTGRVFLGDMVLSLTHVQMQAKEYGHSLRREIAYLTIHSMLHLLGYDHIDEAEEKKQMRAREELILQSLRLGRR